jgi:hypothetical protein
MIRRNVSLPELGLVAGTRMVLGAGIGLLVASRLEPGPRRAAGWALLGVGVVTTFPLVAQILFGESSAEGRGIGRRQPGPDRVAARRTTAARARAARPLARA